MGICNSEPKKPKLLIDISAQNEESEKGMVERLKELLNQKGINIDISSINIKQNLLYMKIIFVKGRNVMTLASGSDEVTQEEIEKIAEEIQKKIKEEGK